MNVNRFEFLEIGDTQSTTPAPAAPEPESIPLAEMPGGGKPVYALDGTPLAQVKVNDSRGYQAYLSQAQDESAVGVYGRQSITARKSWQGILRAAEVFGQRGVKAGEFSFPAGLAVDRRGVLFVADSYNHRIQRITPDGGVAVIGGRGAGQGEFLSPQGIATDDRSAFYVVEQGNHRVQKYSSEGMLELMFGRPGHRDGELHGPTGIAVSPQNGDIYIADTGNRRVQRFDCAGRFLSSVGGQSRTMTPRVGFTPLVNPQAVTVDNAGTLYVADTLAHQVARYDPLGRFLGYAGGGFHEPRALAWDFAGLLYVADSGQASEGEARGRVQAISPQGQPLATLEKPGRNLGVMARPGGLAVGPAAGHPSGSGPARGDLYVSDTMNHRILRFVWE